jgi:hypothetical protein
MGSNPETAPQLFESIRCLVPPGGFRCQFLSGVLDDSLGVRGDCSAGERRVRAWSKILFRGKIPLLHLGWSIITPIWESPKKMRCK